MSVFQLTLFCTQLADNIEVEYNLKSSSKPIGIVEYKLTDSCGLK